MLKPEIFQCDDGFIRYDWKWYGVGRMPHVFWNNMAIPGVCYFLNSYRTAPFYFRLLNRFGKLDTSKYPNLMPQSRWFFTGSMVEPRASWRLRFGSQWFIGGETPKFIQRIIRKFDDRRWRKWEQNHISDEPICLICELPGDQCACEPNGIFDPADLPKE